MRPSDWYRPHFTLRARSASADGQEDRTGGRDAKAEQGAWDAIVSGLTVVLDPVVGAHSGRLLGLEAVIANAADLGFASSSGLMNSAHDAAPAGEGSGGVRPLAAVEDAIHAAALTLFARLPVRAGLKLFLPFDARRLDHAGPVVAALRARARSGGVPLDALVPMLSTRLPLLLANGADARDDSGEPAESAREAEVERRINDLRGLSGRFALTGFGAGTACLPLLSLTRPDFVRLAPAFARTDGKARTRRLVLNALANLSNLMGTQVIASGIDTVAQYRACRQAGCDYVQGRLVGGAVADPADLVWDCEAIRALNEADQRTPGTDAALIASQTRNMEPIIVGTPMSQVFERFRLVKDQTFLPTVDEAGEPVGIVRELDLKEYTYSLYGKDLLSNRALGRTLDGFVVPCPVADVNTKAERILDLFSAAEGADCVLITQDRRYMGFLSASSLLKVIGEKNLAMARDQNPLSRLPGNTMINEYLAEALSADTLREPIMVYVDFDHFKPFNDAYGYRQGDRAITLFAELLRKSLPQDDVFLGHVGGDDFFIGFKDFDLDHVRSLVADLIASFRRDVESFYDEDTRRKGHMVARDRDGVERCLPLLGASAAIIEVPRGHGTRSADEIAGLIARYKKKAKHAASGIACGRVGDDASGTDET